MNQENKAKDKEPVVIYFVYAAAAWFGLQFLMGKNRAGAAPAAILPEQRQPAPVYTPAEVAVPVPHTPARSATKVQSKWITESFPLRKGMKGGQVAVLQKKLGVVADGAFGDKTEVALLQQHGISTITQAQFNSITQGSPWQQLVNTVTAIAKPKPVQDNSPILKSGSKGAEVYRLQKWLGFKDKGQAKKGDFIADSSFGSQTQAALQKRTGQVAISTSHLNTLMLQGGGIVNWLRQ